jgi:hypothetical protein
VVLTTQPPKRSSEGDAALRATGADTVFDVIDMLSADDLERLRRYAAGRVDRPLPGFWRSRELGA